VGGLAILLTVCFGAAAIAGIVVWSRGGLAPGVASRFAIPVLLALSASAANSWPATTAGFTTSQPWGLQAASMGIALLLAGLVAAAAIGLVGALAVTWLKDHPRPRPPRGAAVALGLLFGGGALAGQKVFASAPALGSYSGAATSLPFLDEPFRVITPYLLLTAGLLMILAVREHFRDRPSVQTTVMTLLAVTAVVVVPGSLQTSLPLWALGGLGVGLLLFAGLRLCAAAPALVPGVVGTVAVLESLTLAWEAPHSGARVGGLLSALVLVALAWPWTRELAGPAQATRAEGQSAEGARASVGSA
jgi:hypothetical protein